MQTGISNNNFFILPPIQNRLMLNIWNPTENVKTVIINWKITSKYKIA